VCAKPSPTRTCSVCVFIILSPLNVGQKIGRPARPLKRAYLVAQFRVCIQQLEQIDLGGHGLHFAAFVAADGVVSVARQSRGLVLCQFELSAHTAQEFALGLALCLLRRATVALLQCHVSI